MTSDKEEAQVISRIRPNSSLIIRHSSLNVVAEYLVLATLVTIFIWRGFVPAWNTPSSDFQDYYLAARLYRQGYSLEQIYDWTWIQRQKDHAGMEGPVVAFALLTPFSLLPVLPFSSLPPLLAKRGWLLLNLVLLGLSAYLLRRMSRLSARRLAILIFLAITPSARRTSFRGKSTFCCSSCLRPPLGFISKTDRWHRD